MYNINKQYRRRYPLLNLKKNIMKHVMYPLAGLILSLCSCSQDFQIASEINQITTENRSIMNDSCGTEGLIQMTFGSCGVERKYYIDLPETYDPLQNYPLLLVFHGKGSGGSNKACQWKTRIGDWVDDNKYIAVYGRAYEDKHWYVDDACLSTVNDVCYVETILDSMKSLYNIDENRIYAMGTSNGAGLCYSLLKTMDDFAAIATFAAYSWEDYNIDSTTKTSLMQVHGTWDGTIPYAGGTLFCLDFINAFGSCQAWADYVGCTIPLVGETETIAGKTIDIGRWCSKKYSPLNPAICKKCKKEVVHYKLNGIGHTIYGEISVIPEYLEYINDQLFAFLKRNKL